MAAGSGSGVALSPTLLLFLLLPLLFFDSGICDGGDRTAASSGNVSERSYEVAPPMEPVKVVKMELMLTESKRWSIFQTCAICTCCAANLSSCIVVPCCFFINCNIPNRPFGLCSFTANACDCNSCN